MLTNLTKEDLIAFEEDIVRCFENKEIRAPIHLDNGNEQQLLDIFEYITKDCWVVGTWRMHYKALLKGVPPEQLKTAILAGKSIGLCFPEYKIVSSAIVGGILPIAVGLAYSMKEKKEPGTVYCFLGDMTFETGIFHECYKYSYNWDLPIVWCVEDNGVSVCTNTVKVWNRAAPTDLRAVYNPEGKLYYYKYQSRYPHAGGLSRVNF